jgi:hypothetical protein
MFHVLLSHTGWHALKEWILPWKVFSEQGDHPRCHQFIQAPEDGLTRARSTLGLVSISVKIGQTAVHTCTGEGLLRLFFYSPFFFSCWARTRTDYAGTAMDSAYVDGSSLPTSCRTRREPLPQDYLESNPCIWSSSLKKSLHYRLAELEKREQKREKNKNKNKKSKKGNKAMRVSVGAISCKVSLRQSSESYWGTHESWRKFDVST